MDPLHRPPAPEAIQAILDEARRVAREALAESSPPLPSPALRPGCAAVHHLCPTGEVDLAGPDDCLSTCWISGAHRDPSPPERVETVAGVCFRFFEGDGETEVEWEGPPGAVCRLRTALAPDAALAALQAVLAR